MKCDICGSKIQETFLGKILGTFIRDSKGKKKIVCSSCQKNSKINEIKTTQ